jgi:hypothetical protein
MLATEGPTTRTVRTNMRFESIGVVGCHVRFKVERTGKGWKSSRQSRGSSRIVRERETDLGDNCYICIFCGDRAYYCQNRRGKGWT